MTVYVGHIAVEFNAPDDQTARDQLDFYARDVKDGPAVRRLRCAPPTRGHLPRNESDGRTEVVR
jgi:hypothetical protein